MGLAAIDIPVFWAPDTSGLRRLQAARHLAAPTRGQKQEVLWASPHFAWELFGHAQRKEEDPRHAFRLLVQRLMPEYFTVLSARHGMDALLAESHQILDLAFMAASWRYTQIVGATVYRMGLSAWPPPEGWFQSEVGRAEEGQARGPATASSQGTLPGAGHDSKPHRGAAGTATASLKATPRGAGQGGTPH